MNTHCRNGHSLDEANTYTPKNRCTRGCLTCKREQALASYRRKRARDISQGLVVVATACRLCGSAIPLPGPQSGARRYCSDKCKWRAGRERGGEPRKESKREYSNRPEVRERERKRKRPAKRAYAAYVRKPPKFLLNAGWRHGSIVVIGVAPIIGGRHIVVRCDCGSEPFVVVGCRLRTMKFCSRECALQKRLLAMADRRNRLRVSRHLECRTCGLTKARRDFAPCELRQNLAVCRACFSVVQKADFQRQRKALTDNYVKKQIAKRTGLKQRDIPHVLVEVKRVQLQIKRLLNERNKAHE